MVSIDQAQRPAKRPAAMANVGHHSVKVTADHLDAAVIAQVVDRRWHE
jgi:hypothetical protein